MKRTHDVNIGGTIFHIEEDSYDRLEAYLSAIGAHFASYPDNADIIADIEGRIAEQLLQTNGTSHIVMIGDVERVIAAMGRADQLGEGDDTEPSTRVPNPTSGVGGRRLFRNPDGKIVAGVAKGLAAYTGLKPWVVRALFIAPWILLVLHPQVTGGESDSTFEFACLLAFVYLLLWFFIPVAKTTTDKLLMRGNPVTLATVEQGVRDRIAVIVPSTRSVSTKLVTQMGSLIRLLVVGMARALGVAVMGFAVLGILMCTVLLVIMVVNMHVMDDVIPIDFLTQLHAWYFPFILCSYFIIAIPLSLAVLIVVAAFRERYHALTRPVMMFVGIWLAALFIWVGIWATYPPFFGRHIPISIEKDSAGNLQVSDKSANGLVIGEGEMALISFSSGPQADTVYAQVDGPTGWGGNTSKFLLSFDGKGDCCKDIPMTKPGRYAYRIWDKRANVIGQGTIVRGQN